MKSLHKSINNNLKTMKKYFIFSVISILFIFSKLEAGNTRNIVVAVIDGARYSETFGDSSHKYIPKIWNCLRPEGTILTSVYIDGGVTETIPGHASIITGTWQEIPNDGSKHPDKPTLFEYYRKQYSSSITDCYLIIGKEKLDIISYSTNKEYGKKYAASVIISKNPANDIEAWLNTKQIMHEYHPHIILINFSATDIAGHSKVWNNYTSALCKADYIVYSLWNYIQSDLIYRNKTTLLITSDHGRHFDKFLGHGCNCDGCRHITFMALGPNIPMGRVVNDTFQQIDILPTISYFMDMKVPFSKGKRIDFLDNKNNIKK